MNKGESDVATDRSLEKKYDGIISGKLITGKHDSDVKQEKPESSVKNGIVQLTRVSRLIHCTSTHF